MQRARPLSVILAPGFSLVAILFVWLLIFASFANARHASLSSDVHCSQTLSHERDGGAPVGPPADHLQGCCAFPCADCYFPLPVAQVSKMPIVREPAAENLVSDCSRVSPTAPERSPVSPRAPPVL